MGHCYCFLLTSSAPLTWTQHAPHPTLNTAAHLSIYAVDINDAAAPSPHFPTCSCGPQLTRQLRTSGFPALGLHGDKSQQERDWVLAEFKNGTHPVMIATDVAARGLGVRSMGCSGVIAGVAWVANAAGCCSLLSLLLPAMQGSLGISSKAQADVRGAAGQLSVRATAHGVAQLLLRCRGQVPGSCLSQLPGAVAGVGCTPHLSTPATTQPQRATSAMRMHALPDACIPAVVSAAVNLLLPDP